MTTTPMLWKSLTQVNTSDNAKFQGGSQVVGLQDGGYLVVWQDESGNYNPPFGDTIVGQRYDPAGNKVGGEVQLSQLPPLGLQLSPAVAVLSNGNIAVAYVDLRGSPPDRDIHVSIFDSALNFIRFDDIDVAGNPKQTYEPSLTALAGGGYVVSYTVGTGDSPGTISDTDIVARIVSANGTVGNQFDIDNQNDNKNFSKVATLANGNFVVVYQDESDGNATDVDVKYAIRKSDGTPAGNGVVSGANDGGLEVDPDVAALRDGGFVVVWTDDANTAVTEIRATILSNTGAPVASNFRVDSVLGGQIGGQHDASVVSLADGGFLVSWADDNHNLVVAQRFDALGNKIGAQVTAKDGVDHSDAALLSDGRIAFAIDDFDATPAPGDEDVNTSIWDPRTPAGNFDGINQSDFLWQRDNGQAAVWLLHDTSVAFNGAVGPNVGPSWHLIDDGDFNADGRSDFLWQNDSGQAAVWGLNNGTNLAYSAAVGPNPGPSWHVIGTGDFNGDNKSDILWQGDDGTPSIWLMNGAQVTWMGAAGSLNPGPTWQVKGTGDFNGDGKSDILWQGDDGTPLPSGS